MPCLFTTSLLSWAPGPNSLKIILNKLSRYFDLKQFDWLLNVFQPIRKLKMSVAQIYAGDFVHRIGFLKSLILFYRYAFNVYLKLFVYIFRFTKYCLMARGRPEFSSITAENRGSFLPRKKSSCRQVPT